MLAQNKKTDYGLLIPIVLGMLWSNFPLVKASGGFYVRDM